MIKTLIDKYCRLLSWLMAASLALMVVLVFTNVVLRYAMNSGIPVSEELSRWLFVWLTFLGAIVALHEHGHLGTDMLVARLPGLGKKAFPEVYAALESKALDGQENPYSVIISKKFWDALSADEKKIIGDAAVEAGKYQRQAARDAAGTALDGLKKAGMQVTELPAAEMAKLRDNLRPVIAKYAVSVGQETVKEIQEELAKARK